MSKILVVFNTCGISGRENTSAYIKNIKYIIEQDYPNTDIVFSSCLNLAKDRLAIRNYFGSNIKYNLIDEIHPVNVTFNHAVNETVKRFGKYEGYIYVDSGTSFVHKNLIAELVKKLETKKYGMITPQPEYDTEYYFGLGVGRFNEDNEYAREILFKDGDYVIPIGKGMASHTNLISEELRQFYGRCYPDIFASHCTESTFTFLNAALGKQWLLLKDFILPHQVSLDGQSSGFSPAKWQQIGGKTYDHPYRISSIIERICTEEAIACGFGYEECRNILKHDSSQFNENQLCNNDKLKDFLKKSLFLDYNELNYDEIKHEYIE